MLYQDLHQIVKSHPAIKLLRKQHADLIAGFLWTCFKKGNENQISSEALEADLRDHLFQLLREDDTREYPQTPKQYLEHWTNEGILKSFYPPGSDEAVFQLTPATEKALDWLLSLEQREFIGTESRLLKIVDILKEITIESSSDPALRLKVLEEQKALLEQEISRVKAGDIPIMSDTQVRERFWEVQDTARRLLSDFRQVEENFRQLDRQAREDQLHTGQSKGKLLERLFNAQDAIWATDQGRSFKAFWEFLMSVKKQEELQTLIAQVLALPQLLDIIENNYLSRFKINLVAAGEDVNKTTHQLVEQLRHFLDDSAMLEHRRIVTLIQEIKTHALEAREQDVKNKTFLKLDHKPQIDMVMDRPLYRPPYKAELDAILLEEGDAELDTIALYTQQYVDPEVLRQQIRTLLKEQQQVSLYEVVEKFPIQKGVAEIVTYLDIAHKDRRAVIKEREGQPIRVFNKDSEKYFNIQIPQIIFSR